MKKSLTSSLLLGVILLAGCTGAPRIPSSQTQGCTPYWQCTDWSGCNGELQTRTCTDSNACAASAGKPSESQACDEEWIPYNFKGGEHLKYEIKLNDTEGMQEGYLLWDIGQKEPDGEFTMNFNISLGGEECTTTIKTKGDEITDIQSELILNPTCFVAFTMLSLTIYSPYWGDITDRGLESWSYSVPGYSVAFTINPTPQSYAGVSCTSGALSRNGLTAFELCASRELGLGIKMTIHDETGALLYDTELVEYS